MRLRIIRINDQPGFPHHYERMLNCFYLSALPDAGHPAQPAFKGGGGGGNVEREMTFLRNGGEMGIKDIGGWEKLLQICDGNLELHT